MHRRHFLHAAAAALGAPLAPPPLTLSALTLPPLARPRQEARVRVLLDADTANEIDDLYAIVRALLEPRFEVVGLSSAQWNHRLSPPDTVRQSQRLNEDLLALLGRRDVPHPLGAEMIVGKPWGGDEPQDSPAARLMITRARQTPPGRKLVILSLGAATNVASAVKLAPDIVPRIACYVLAGSYHAGRRVWNKDEFNLRNDLNAANVLFNTAGLELHVMPVNILTDFRLGRDEVMRRLAGQRGVWEYLATRWLTFSPGSETWVMWDLALVLALARPELATEMSVMTPPENAQREVRVYTAVDREGMVRDWWRVVAAAQR